MTRDLNADGLKVGQHLCTLADSGVANENLRQGQAVHQKRFGRGVQKYLGCRRVMGVCWVQVRPGGWHPERSFGPVLPQRVQVVGFEGVGILAAAVEDGLVASGHGVLCGLFQ